jgi:hypothetical protein
VDRVYYRLNEDRLKDAALEYSARFAKSQQMRAFNQYIKESFAQETPKYRAQIQAQHDELFEAEQKAWCNRIHWDGSVNSLNKYVSFALFFHNFYQLFDVPVPSTTYASRFASWPMQFQL